MALQFRVLKLYFAFSSFKFEDWGYFWIS